MESGQDLKPAFTTHYLCGLEQVSSLGASIPPALPVTHEVRTTIITIRLVGGVSDAGIEGMPHDTLCAHMLHGPLFSVPVIFPSPHHPRSSVCALLCLWLLPPI